MTSGRSRFSTERRSTVGRTSIDARPTLGRRSTDISRPSADARPTHRSSVGRQLTDVTYMIHEPITMATTYLIFQRRLSAAHLYLLGPIQRYSSLVFNTSPRKPYAMEKQNRINLPSFSSEHASSCWVCPDKEHVHSTVGARESMESELMAGGFTDGVE